jgi:hypothetical protein
LAENEEATTPYTAADALQEVSTLETEETEESPVVIADEDQPEDETETEEETEEESTEEDSQDADNDDEEDDDLDDLSTKLALDKTVADALPEDARKRYEQQVKGLAKKDKQIQSELEVLNIAKGLENALFHQDAETAKKALQSLTETVLKHHQVEAKAEVQEPTETDTGWEYDGRTFYSERELELYQQIQELKAQKEDPEIEEIKAERRAQKEAKAIDSWVDSNSQKIIAKVAAKAGGWGVTKEQIAEVARMDKQALESDPVMAMKRAFPDAYADHRAGAKPKPVKEMITGSQSKGYSIPEDPDEYNAAYALMEISS